MKKITWVNGRDMHDREKSGWSRHDQEKSGWSRHGQEKSGWSRSMLQWSRCSTMTYDGHWSMEYVGQES